MDSSTNTGLPPKSGPSLNHRHLTVAVLIMFVGIAGYLLGRYQTKLADDTAQRSDEPKRRPLRSFDGRVKLSPFEAVRWDQVTPQVKIRGEWYELIALDGYPAGEIVKACQRADPEEWQRRFGEDLAEIMAQMGHAIGPLVKVGVKRPPTGEVVTLDNVPNTLDNRNAIRDARATSGAKK